LEGHAARRALKRALKPGCKRKLILPELHRRDLLSIAMDTRTNLSALKPGVAQR
jgi:hypothetical protein